jgi:hypothetical protein
MKTSASSVRGFLGYKTPVKTNGGYLVRELKRLSVLESRGNLKPFVYEGRIDDSVCPWLGNNVLVKWDVDGKCANWDRKDCFIDPKIFEMIR